MTSETVDGPAAPTSPHGGPGVDSRGRALLVLACLLVAVVSATGTPGFGSASVLAVAAAVVLVAVLTRGPARHVRWGLVLRASAYSLVVLGLLFSSAWVASAAGDVATPLWTMTALGYCVLGGCAVLLQRTRFGGSAFWVFLVLHVVAMVLVLHVLHARIDVFVFQDEGASGLLHGVNPYAMSFTDPFPGQDSSGIYAPGLVEAGRINVGFPYLPTPLLTAVPGLLLGDVRYTQLLALVLVAVVMRRMATDEVGRLLAFAAVVGPASVLVVVLSWVEPVLVALLAVFVLLQRGGRPRFAAVSLGLLLASKQYLAVVVPLLVTACRLLGFRRVLGALGVAAAVTLPFFLAGPADFWKNVVTLQLVQPLRPDSLSLLTASVHAFGWPPPAVYGVLPLAAGFAVSSLVAWRARPTSTVLVVGIGLSLLVTCLLSKQAFVNYYLLVAGAFLLGAVTWPADEPAVERAGDSEERVADLSEASVPVTR